MLAGSVLGARRGFLALLLFLVAGRGRAAGAVGRRAAGSAVFVGPTAGYLYSWPIAAFVIGCSPSCSGARYNLAWALRGQRGRRHRGHLRDRHPVPQRCSADIPLATAFAGSLAFIPGDLVKAVVAALVAVAVRRAYPVIELPRPARDGRLTARGPAVATAAERGRGRRRPARGRRSSCAASATATATGRCSPTSTCGSPSSGSGSIGANGSGKSTFARLLNGLVLPDRGHGCWSTGWTPARTCARCAAGSASSSRTPTPRSCTRRSPRTSRSGCRTRACRPAERARAGGRGAGPLRPGRARRPPGAPALRRPEAAAGDRRRAGQRPAADRVRRADDAAGPGQHPPGGPGDRGAGAAGRRGHPPPGPARRLRPGAGVRRTAGWSRTARPSETVAPTGS